MASHRCIINPTQEASQVRGRVDRSQRCPVHGGGVLARKMETQSLPSLVVLGNDLVEGTVLKTWTFSG